MPGSIFAEFILRPIVEAILSVFCYWTGRIIVPLLSLGQVRIERTDSKQLKRRRRRADRKRAGPPRRARLRWHGFHRAPDGAIVIDDDMTMCLGLLFWAAVGTAAYFLFR